MVNWARRERAWLCDELERVGPDQPTLCGDWQTRDLAAHLVLRERRPDAAIGVLAAVGPFARWTEHVQRELAARPWDVLVGMVRSGPPPWTPMAFDPIDAAANTIEYFVHHEDVRRAVDGWSARDLDPAEDEALAGAARRMRLLVRRSPVGLVLRTSDGAVLVDRSGPRPVTVTGRPGELVLFAFGRQAHSDVRYDGADADIEAVRTARFGL